MITVHQSCENAENQFKHHSKVEVGSRVREMKTPTHRKRDLLH